MNLISLRVWPELRPATIFVLSAKQIVDTFAESISVALLPSSLIQAGEIGQLHICCSIIGGGVIQSLLVFQHLCLLLVIQWFDHIDILRPAASDALI